MSISSAKLIQKRTLEFCYSIKEWELNARLFESFNKFLNKEYYLIPDKERIGKGIKYISNHVAKGVFQHLFNKEKINRIFIYEFIEALFNYGENVESQIIQLFALHIIAEFISSFPNDFEKMLSLIKKYACHRNWIVRETIADSIIAGLKKNIDITLIFLNKWAKNSNENLRRLVSESLRPHNSIKWLRDPTKNDKILDILTILRNDPSLYVRKSVGNNLKDLSKYMPEKILDLLESWIRKAQIIVHDELATELGLNQEEKRLIWTMKYAMRWIKNKNPEYHSRLE
ncbi:MAG: DNA alkylation repair protein, partial [Candidatus Odinarchaeota archaeon]